MGQKVGGQELGEGDCSQLNYRSLCPVTETHRQGSAPPPCVAGNGPSLAGRGMAGVHIQTCSPRSPDVRWSCTNAPHEPIAWTPRAGPG